MKNVKPNDKRAQIAIALIWTVLAMELVSLISGYLQYDLLQTVAKGGEVSMGDANANDLREKVVGVIYFIVFIISSVTFIQWFRRAYCNLHQQVNYLSNTEDWAAKCWFVPIVNLYKPFQIMKELYEESKELLLKKGLIYNEDLGSGYLTFWWTLWITNSIIGQWVFRYSLKAESLDELTISTVGGMINNAMGIPLALITVKIIKDYAQIEPLMHEIKPEEDLSNTDWQ